MSTILLTFVASLWLQAVPTQAYRNSQCSYSFEYPRDWQLVKDPTTTYNCATTLRPSDYEKRMAELDVDVFTITVQASGQSFQEAAEDNGFEFNGKWEVLGRMGMRSQAQVSSSRGWLILRGIASVGCFSEKGGYSGLCDEYRVVAKRKDDQILVITGGAKTGTVIDIVLKTFKFLTR